MYCPIKTPLTEQTTPPRHSNSLPIEELEAVAICAPLQKSQVDTDRSVDHRRSSIVTDQDETSEEVLIEFPPSFIPPEKVTIESFLLDNSPYHPPRDCDDRRFMVNTLDKYASYDFETMCEPCLHHRQSETCLHLAFYPFVKFTRPALGRIIKHKTLREHGCSFIYSNSITLGENSRTTKRVFDFMLRVLKKDIKKKISMFVTANRKNNPLNKIVPQSGFTLFNVGLDDGVTNRFDTFIEEFKRVKSDLRDLAPSTEMADRLISSVETLAEAASSASSSSVVKNLNKFTSLLDFSPVDKDTKIIELDEKSTLSFCCLLASSFLYFRVPTKVNLACVVVSLIGTFTFTKFYTFGSLYESIFGLVQVISKMVCAPKDIQAQSGNEEFFDAFNLAFSTIFSYTSGKNVPMEFFKTAGTIGRSKTTLIDICKSILKMFEEATNYVLLHYTELPSVRFMRSKVTDIDDYLTRVLDVFDLYNRNNFLYSLETKSALDALVIEGKTLIRSFPKDRHTDNAVRLLFDEVQKLIKIQKEFQAETSSMKGAKQEAVIVMFRGGPGVGKSVTLEKFSQDFVRSILSPLQIPTFEENYATFIYARMGIMGFWDGYNPQIKAVLYDDFMQSRDFQGTQNPEVMEFIRGGSSFPFPLHMAGVEEKGKMYMNAELIAATTNAASMNFETITKPEALFRRINFDYIVSPHPDFLLESTKNLSLWDQKFDFSKLPLGSYTYDGLEYTITNLHPYAQIFTPCDNDGIPIGDSLGYDEILSRSLKLRDIKRAWFLRAMEEFKNPTLKSDFFPDIVQQSGRVFTGVDSPNSTYVDMESIFPPDKIDLLDDDEFFDWKPRVQDLTDFKFDFNQDSVWNWKESFPSQVVDLTEKVFSKVGFDHPMFPVVVDRTMSVASDIFPKDVFYGVNFGPVLLASVIYYIGTPFVDFLRGEIPYGSLRPYTRSKFIEIVPLKKIEPNPQSRSFLRLCKTWIEEAIESVEPVFARWIKWFDIKKFSQGLLAISVVFLFVNFLYKPLAEIGGYLFTLLFGANADAQSFGHSDKGGSKKVNKNWKFNSSTVKKDLGIVPQGGSASDPGGYDLVTSIFNKNTYLLMTETAPGSSKYESMGSIVFVDGRIALMPYHFILKILSYVEDNPEVLDCKLKLCKTLDPSSFGYSLFVRDLIKGHQTGALAQKDLVLVEFPRNVQLHVNRVKNFADVKDYNRNARNMPFVLKIRGFDTETVSGIAHAVDKIEVGCDYTDPYTVREVYCYQACTSIGDCGSIFSYMNPKTGDRKVFGIHIAGNTALQSGYAVAICQQELEEELKLFDKQIVSEDPEQIVPQCSGMTYPKNFSEVGVLDRLPQIVSHSRIVRSKLYGEIVEPITAPAKLKPFLKDGVLIEPMSIISAKYCPGSISIEPELVEAARESLYDYLLNNAVFKVDKRLWSWEEVWYGLPNDSDCRGMPTDTSAGWPMNVIGEVNWKKKLFSCPRDSPENLLAQAEIGPMLDEIENKYRTGIRPVWICFDFLKDERLKIAKVQDGKTRMISGVAWFYYCVYRRYFGAFHVWMAKNRIGNGTVIGVNPYSIEWELLAQKLNSFDVSGNAMVGAGDYTFYDGHEQPIVHYAILDMINDWYDDGEVNALVREILWLEIVNSKHIVGNQVLEWPMSLPSGSPATMIVNCLNNLLLFRMCWVLLGLDIQDFNNNVYVAVMGDDNVFSVSHAYRHIFNEMTLSEPMSELGMIYTSETKEASIVPFRHISEVEFLKRGFRFEPILGRHVGPLRLAVILEMVCWTKKGANNNDIVASNVDMAIDELSLHERAVYNKYANLISDKFQKFYPGVKTSRSLFEKYTTRQSKIVKSDFYYC